MKRLYTIALGTAAALALAGRAALAYPTGCVGDTDGDNWVDVNDLNNVLMNWGGGGPGDVDDEWGSGTPDGMIDVNDLVCVIVNWGDCPGCGPECD